MNQHGHWLKLLAARVMGSNRLKMGQRSPLIVAESGGMVRRSRPWLLLVIGVVGVVVSGGASWWVGRWERSLRQLEFERQTLNLTIALAGRLNQYTETLLALGDFYAASGPEVTAMEFSQFVQRVTTSYPGIQALEWAPQVLERDRTAYEGELQAQRLGATQITEQNGAGRLIPAGQRPEYFPVTYIEPWPGNEVALGFDLLSDRVRSQALQQSRRTGKLTATAPIRLVQEPENQWGFLVFLPVPQEPGGALLGVFQVNDLVEEAWRSLQIPIDVVIRDRTAATLPQPLGFYHAETQRFNSTPTHSLPSLPESAYLCPQPCTQSLAVGQRQWQLHFFPAPTYPPTTPWAMGATFIIGLLLTAFVGLVGWHWDTQLKQTRAMGEAKLKFFSMTSHEFRNPLSTILISSQFLITHAPELSDRKRLSIYQRIQSVARYMSQILEDILMLSRAEAGHLAFHPKIVDLNSFCQAILADVDHDFDSQNRISYHNYYPYDHVFIDPKLVKWILMNLLSNAIKYSPADPVISLVITGYSEELQIVVQDQGMGMSEAEQARVFEPFYRGSNAEMILGTGLGLAVVKTCVDLHQGAIALDSVPHQGTIVRITLPLAA
jgi:signal transduction histidine kinase